MVWGPAALAKRSPQKGFINGTHVVSTAAPPRCPIEITCNEVNLLTNHNGSDCEDQLFHNTQFFVVDIANMWRQNCKKFSGR